MNTLDQSAKKMFAELEVLNARFQANVSDVTTTFESDSGERHTFHFYGIDNGDVNTVMRAIRKTAVACGVKALETIARSPGLK